MNSTSFWVWALTPVLYAEEHSGGRLLLQPPSGRPLPTDPKG